MARTEPHNDWQQTDSASRTNAEWESLRNELVALLDQVEDQIGTSHKAPAPKSPAPERPEMPPAPTGKQASRHEMALRSVRLAVDKLAERGDADAGAAKPDSVTEAINQIRARQGRQTHQAAQSAPRDIPPAPEPQTPVLQTEAPAAASSARELAGFADAVSQLGDRITQFESRISERFDSLDQSGDVAGQIAQLSEVIELLANAVGESGQVKRLETQIAQLADEVSRGHSGGPDAIAAQVEALAESIDKLATHQVQNAGRDAQAEARQADSMRVIEESVRSIYDRIDALEKARPDGSDAFERLSKDLAALAATIEYNSDTELLVGKIDALGARIAKLETAPQGSVNDAGMLRDAVTEAIDPRLSALETRIDDLGTRLDGATAAPQDLSGIEAQLRHLSQRVEETGAELKVLAGLYETQENGTDGIDIDALARAIAAHNPPSPGSDTADAIARADLEALETRLSGLLARESDAGGHPDEHLSGVKDGIAQVDSRLARLEAMLNGKQARTAETEPAPRPAQPPRRAASDAMPNDPASGAAGKVEAAGAPFSALSQAPLAGPAPLLEPEPVRDAPRHEAGPTFTLDPERVERPAKPQSRLGSDLGDETPNVEPLEPTRDQTEPDLQSANASRASFIEAARRSARQHVSEDDSAEPKSLIGRALARFQRSEASEDDADEMPDEQAAKSKPEKAPAEPEFEGFGGVDDDVDPDAKRPGFIARNKRPLLLGTALVVVLLLTAQLVISRGQGNRVPAPAPAPAESTVPAETGEVPTSDAGGADAAAPGKTTPSSAGDADGALTSNVRMIDQSPALASAQPDIAAMMGDLGVDATETAAIPPDPDRYIESASTGPLTTAPITLANLPATTVPEDIQPAQLREAAEEGDARAQFEVGAILTEGHVVEQDLSQAAAWYERAAAQGFAPAQYRLGNLYENGQGVDKDLEQARLWYQRAAESGNRMSMHNLASLYAGGELSSQDFDAAAHWFEEAAARGLTDSQFNLGMLYARGLGVEQSFENSYIWFSLAARSGDEDAAAARDDVARSLDADTVQRLNQTIESWIPVEIDMAANFAPIGTWDEEFDPGREIGNADVIKRVQELLDKLGYDVGTPDGIVGPLTRAAITAFEQATGMSESGEINPRLLAVLGSQPV
ncbi:SEL1-like repeat protein [Pelagibacterium xiamenense]|uniref:SEL1-like repeat protein n=1 Tax=Pelagibacterium xiamenense TaxID=2901140 RepID=UPI001E297291|nr:SEL1-like repeat protein [Pelagibacterium xiamenense]MCD7059081.1 peptidoglycan-binding protein [Pelagibacterium xiamenense]